MVKVKRASENSEKHKIQEELKRQTVFSDTCNQKLENSKKELRAMDADN